MCIRDRGEITEFSPKSARRLREFLLKLLSGAWAEALLLTLTYPVEVETADYHVYKEHLHEFSKRFARQWPGASAVWRLEFTKAGKPHYHLVLFGLGGVANLQGFRDWVDWAWFEVVGSGLEKHRQAGCNVELVKSAGGAAHYLAKYVSKMEQAAPCQGFTGRYWGAFSRVNLPVAPLEVTPMTLPDAKKVSRVFRKLLAAQMNEARWKKALHQIGPWGVAAEWGWTRERCLRGVSGVGFMHLHVPAGFREDNNGHVRETIPHDEWRFPSGVNPDTSDKVLEVASWGHAPTCDWKPPPRWKPRNNFAGTLYADATRVREQLEQWLHPEPDRPGFAAWSSGLAEVPRGTSGQDLHRKSTAGAGGGVSPQNGDLGSGAAPREASAGDVQRGRALARALRASRTPWVSV